VNQEQVKRKLLEIKRDVADFKVIFSGKESKKVDGLYYPESCEIILHNRNFVDDSQLIYTAIHEFSHHIQFTTSPLPISVKAHSVQFWNIFHSLLFRAEQIEIYKNIFEIQPEFKVLTQKIKKEFLGENGYLMKELGQLLIKAQSLCEQFHASFEDYLDRILRFPRASSRVVMKTHAFNLNPRIGYENMKVLTGIKDETSRKQAEKDFLEGQSSDMIKFKYQIAPKADDPLQRLREERKRVENSIQRMSDRLGEIDKRIEMLEKSSRLKGSGA